MSEIENDFVARKMNLISVLAESVLDAYEFTDEGVQEIITAIFAVANAKAESTDCIKVIDTGYQWAMILNGKIDEALH